jgi:hypothetical protein
MRTNPGFSSRSGFFWTVLVLAAVASLLAAPALGQESALTAAPQPLISQPVDESQLTTLKGNTHPLARPEFDLGTAPASLPMERMLLVLKRSPAQESALRKLLDDQQDKASPNYHKWLTPEEFGKQFGPTDSDMQTITSWLQSHGFQVGTTKGRTVLDFSGSASQVQEAFHTAIHRYIVNGDQHWANASDPKIPTALTGAVAGIHTLHNFLKKPMVHFSGEKASAQLVPGKPPLVTFSDGTHALGPQDYATIYNINPLYQANPPVSGGGMNIGVVARSNLFYGGEDVYGFASVFNTNISMNILVNGPDPGDLGGGEEAEATLDATWSGAIAPGANVDFVVSASTNTTDGVDLSELYIIEGNFAAVMTESFGSCEANVTNTEAQGISAMAQQAAAEGITYIVSSGDSGAEGCDNPNYEATATGPVSVNVLASSPYTVAAGGTMFNENGQGSKYWRAAGQYITGSAISYIPEDVWNESCTSAQCGQNANIWSAGGGKSTLFTKPSWQAGVSGIPTDGARDLPDISLTAAGHDPYLVCLEGSCIPNGQGQIYLYFISGTSAAAPSFAGIMALVDTKMAQLSGQQASGPQGQADYVLYRLAAGETFSQCNGSSTSTTPASTCIFNDVTSGNNAVPGELNYGSISAQYQSGAGYDPATGLGSVNVTNLVNKWSTVTFNPTTTTIVSASPTTITHGQPVNVNVTVTSSSGTPTGTVAVVGIDQEGHRQTAGVFPLSGGAFLGQVPTLPGTFTGLEWLTAEYSGDGTFAPGIAPEVGPFTVNPEPSKTTLTAQTLTVSGNNLYLTSLGSSVGYGNMVYLHADVAGQSGLGTPTGTVTFADANGDPSIPGNPYQISSAGSAVTPFGLFTLPVGAYAVTAQYSSDYAFNASTSPALTFNITPAATSSVVTSSVSTIGANGSVTLTANIATGTASSPSFGSAPTGTVSFYANGTIVGTAQSVVGTAGAANFLTGPFNSSFAKGTLVTTALPTGSDSITATYSGDSNYATSTSAAITVTVSPDFSLPTAGLGTVTISSPGGTGTVNLTITPGSGFNAAVNFSCFASTLPKGTSCGSASIPAGQTTGTMTVTTTSSRAMLRSQPPSYFLAWWTACGILPLAGMIVIWNPRRRRRMALLSVLLMAILLLLPACGGSGGGGGGGGGGTPAGQYTVSVIATSGSLTHSTTFTLVVQ